MHRQRMRPVRIKVVVNGVERRIKTYIDMRAAVTVGFVLFDAEVAGIRQRGARITVNGRASSLTTRVGSGAIIQYPLPRSPAGKE